MPQTGPRTPEGRQKSSQNAIKHGLTSSRLFVLENEDPETWAALLRVWTDKLRPKDEAELSVVHDIALAQWGLRRCRTWEAGLMNIEMTEQAETLAETYDVYDESVCQASAFKALADQSRALDLLHRCETRHRRAFERGLSVLEKLRAMTAAEPGSPHALQNETVAAQSEVLQNEDPELPRLFR